MTPQPEDSQLPGLPDSQVGCTDLGDRGYPWAQQARHEEDPRNTSTHPRHLEIGASITYGNSHPSFDHGSHGHSLSIRRFTELSSSQSYTSEPTNPLPGDGHLLLPSSTWANLSSPSTSNNRPSFPSMDLGKHLPRDCPLNNYYLHSPGQETYPGPTNSTVPEDNPRRRHELADPNHEEFTPVCEFSHPCRRIPSPDGTHFRKIVSHICERNKSSTKLFPEWVWVWYCRGHYQRVRYRTEQWPFTQFPEWLQREIGIGKTFDNIRHIVYRIREYLARLKCGEDSKKDTCADLNGASTTAGEKKKLRQNTACMERNSLVRFPDIEILHTFHPEIMEQARLRAAQKKSGGQAEPNDEQEDVGEMDDDYEDRVEQKVSRPTHSHRRQGKGRKNMTTRVSDRGASKKPLFKKPNDKK